MQPHKEGYPEQVSEKHGLMLKSVLIYFDAARENTIIKVSITGKRFLQVESIVKEE